MAKKRNFTKAGRYFAETKPLATRPMSEAPPTPPPGHLPFHRLHLDGPTEKIKMSGAELAARFGPNVHPDAIFFLDTSIFTSCESKPLWELFRSRAVFISQAVWKELQPWIATPFKNQDVRDYVRDCVREQSLQSHEMHLVASNGGSLADFALAAGPKTLKFSVCMGNSPLLKQCRRHGSSYYFRLLSLRKFAGTWVEGYLTSKLRRSPSKDERAAAFRRWFGERGMQFAQKGINRGESANLLTDENTVVLAVFTAIITGRPTYIVTTDTDLPDQFCKLYLLIKEHYRSMMAAERYADRPDSMAFQKVPVADPADGMNPWVGPSILQFRLPDADFNVLPPLKNSTVAHCILLNTNYEQDPRMSYCCFTAEEDIKRVLQVKAATGGLSTDRFGGRNCTIRTEPLTPEQLEVVVSIGMEKKFIVPNWGIFGADDFHNVLASCEALTHLTPATMPTNNQAEC